MRVYVTQHALTQGIQEIMADQCLETQPDGSMIRDMEAPVPTSYHVQGRDWHLTRALAIARAEQMRLAKIASLRRQIAKLEALSAEFDALLARMQTRSARAGMSAAFDSSPKQLGQAAVMAVRTRGR